MAKETKYISKCKKCGGTDVEKLVWYKPNTKEVGEDFSNEDQDTFCHTCNENTGVIVEKTKE